MVPPNGPVPNSSLDISHYSNIHPQFQSTPLHHSIQSSPLAITGFVFNSSLPAMNLSYSISFLCLRNYPCKRVQNLFIRLPELLPTSINATRFCSNDSLHLQIYSFKAVQQTTSPTRICCTLQTLFVHSVRILSTFSRLLQGARHYMSPLVDVFPKMVFL